MQFWTFIYFFHFLLLAHDVTSFSSTTRSSGPLLVPKRSSIRKANFAFQLHSLKLSKVQDDIRLPQIHQSNQHSTLHNKPEASILPTFPDVQEIESTVESATATSSNDTPMSIWAARGLLLLVAAIWGTNFASVKYLENLCFHPPCHHPPSEAAFARFGVAALVSLPLLFKQRWDVIRAGLECGAWIMLGYVSQAMALSTIPSGKCAFICSLTVVFVPLASAVFFKKPIKPATLVAAIVALFGVGVLEGMVNVNELLHIAPAVAADIGGTAAGTIESSQAAAIDTSSSLELASSGQLGSLANWLGVGKGDILALGQPIGFGSAFLRIEQAQEQFKQVPNRVLTIAAAQCVAVGVMAFLWVLYDYHWVMPDFGYMIEPHRLAAIGWTGIVTTVFAIFLEGIALQTATATDASIAFSSEPVWASLFGFLLLHEKLGTNSYVGGTIIMMACFLGAVSDLKQKAITDETLDNSQS